MFHIYIERIDNYLIKRLVNYVNYANYEAEVRQL